MTGPTAVPRCSCRQPPKKRRPRREPRWTKNRIRLILSPFRRRSWTSRPTSYPPGDRSPRLSNRLSGDGEARRDPDGFRRSPTPARRRDRLMERNLFAGRFRAAAQRDRDFARTFFEEPLPNQMRFRVRLNASYDGTASDAFRLYPDDGSPELAEKLATCTEEQVIATLWRKGLVPQWVNQPLGHRAATRSGSHRSALLRSLHRRREPSRAALGRARPPPGWRPPPLRRRSAGGRP